MRRLLKRILLVLLPRQELPLQGKSNPQGDLVVAHGSILDVASRLHHFEPLYIANGFGCAGDRILNGILGAFLGRADEFEDLVNMVFHFGRIWHGEPPLSCAWGNPGLSRPRRDLTPRCANAMLSSEFRRPVMLG